MPYGEFATYSPDGKQVAYLPQSPTADGDHTVFDVLRLGRAPYWGAFGLESARDEQVVPEVRKRDPVLSGVPLSLSTRACCLGAVPFSRRPRATQCLVFSPSPAIPSTCTLICFGLISAFLGSLTRSTPLRHSAVVFSVSTVVGTVKVRLKGP